MTENNDNQSTRCQIPESVSIDVQHTDESKLSDDLLIVLKQHRTIKHVLDWCLAHTPALDLADMVTQDEYTHDFIVPYSDDTFIVYDTT